MNPTQKKFFLTGVSLKTKFLSVNLQALIVAGFCCLSANTAQSSVMTSFEGSTLDPDVHLDVPNTGVGTIMLDTVNQALHFMGSGDLWYDRNGLPFAWTDKPQVGEGGTWRVETALHYNELRQETGARIAGITLYDGPDGTGGSSYGQEFTFGLDQWDNPYGVWIQGLGDNQPGDSGNICTGVATDSVFLRLEVTEHSVSDDFYFYYKLNEGDAWTSLGSMHAKFDDSRVALFFKGDSVDVSFDYFNVQAIPEPNAFAVYGLVLAGVLAFRRGRIGARCRIGSEIKQRPY